MTVRRSRLVTETGTLVFVVVVAVAICCVLLSAAIVWKMTARQMEAVKSSPVRSSPDPRHPFVESWSVRVMPALVQEFAVDPVSQENFSPTSKWTGAIDLTSTTDYFLHALDTRGQTVLAPAF